MFINKKLARVPMGATSKGGNKPGFFSPAAFDITASTIEQRNDGCKRYPQCPWRKEINAMIRNLHSRLCTFGFLGETDYSDQNEQPLGKCWNLESRSFQEETLDAITSRLCNQSSALMMRLPFEAMLQQALGRDFPEPKVFHEYQWLNTRLYYSCLRQYYRREDLLQIEDTLRIAHADPLICAVIRNVYECLGKRALKDPDLNTPLHRLIIRPLEQHFNKNQPAEVISRQAEVLKHRFSRFIVGLDGNWSEPLDICTDFLDGFKSIGPSGFATALTEMDYLLYQKLHYDSFKKNEEAVKNIRQRSDTLTLSVQECLATSILTEREILEFAQELYSLRNYYSVHAVRRGTKRSDFSRLTLQIDSLFNATQELKSDTPALLPVFEHAAYKQDTGLAEKSVSRCASFSVEAYGPAEGRAPSCESIDIADTTIYFGMKCENDTSVSSKTALTSAYEGTDLQGRKGEKMEYYPPTSGNAFQLNETVDRCDSTSFQVLTSFFCCY